MLIPISSIKNKWPSNSDRVERMVTALRKNAMKMTLGVHDKGDGIYSIEPTHSVLLEALKIISNNDPEFLVECQIISN